MCWRSTGCGGDGQQVGQWACCEEGAFEVWLSGNVGGEANAGHDQGELAGSVDQFAFPQETIRIESKPSSAPSLRHVFHLLPNIGPSEVVVSKQDTHRAPIAPLSAASRETIGSGPMFGVATGSFPTALF